MTETTTPINIQISYLDTPVDLLTEARMILQLEAELGGLKLNPSRQTLQRILAYSASLPGTSSRSDGCN